MARLPSVAVPRLAAPLLFAAAIVVSFQLRSEREPVTPVELASGMLPEPSEAETRAAYEVALAPGAPGVDLGATRAAVTVVEFADFGCRYCARFTAESFPALAAEFVATGRVRWRYVPFVLGMFANGTDAARAAECAGAQGREAVARMHDGLYRERERWMQASDPSAVFRTVAGRAGLNARRFAECLTSAAPDDRVRASNALAERLGVFATPTFFINGRRVEGALPADQFRALLRDALREAT